MGVVIEKVIGKAGFHAPRRSAHNVYSAHWNAAFNLLIKAGNKGLNTSRSGVNHVYIFPPDSLINLSICGASGAMLLYIQCIQIWISKIKM
ncbi:hypothetical protein BMS3Abin16_01644 [archaeon BMS3Abin16]|nr:hypothetical protein BMS3Abin16_01644 [archaeon BMS3Abin16]